MDIMTDEEADFWDEFFTRNTIMPDPNRRPLTGRILGDQRRSRICARPAPPTQGQVVSAIVRKELVKSA